MPNFESIRISLAKWEETPLFGAETSPLPIIPRRELLEQVFSAERTFVHRGRAVIFLPVEAPDGFAAGYFGRQVHIRGHSKKDRHFEPEDIDTYDLAFFAVDLAHDQQIAMIQYNGRVGDPRAMLESFFSSAPVRDMTRDYRVHIKPLSSEAGYYQAAEKYAGQITKITFTFIPPNALRAEEKVWAFITEASKDAGSETLSHEYDSPAGHLDPKANLLAGSERVAAQGGGETVMKAGRKTIFRSLSHKLSTYISAREMPEGNNPLQIAAFIHYLFRGER